jgi:hypothetical protein
MLMRSLQEFWRECQDNFRMLKNAEPTALVLFGQFASIVYTGMKWNEEDRSEKHAQPSDGENGGEKGKTEKQEMSDLSHMRKMERGRVLYCLDYIMRSLNDEDAQDHWLIDGVPDSTINDRNFLTEEQVEDHADLVDSQQELDGFVALAAKILFSEVYPKAWSLLVETFDNKLEELLTPERCVLT